MNSHKPTKAELQAAILKTVPDIIAPGLRVLFCGINPGLYSGAVGHHFARPGNRFWPTLHASGFTPRLFSPFEEQLLLEHGYGITNVVNRTTATAAELGADEFVVGGQRLAEKVRSYQPRYLAVLGIGAYRMAFARPKAQLGLQPDTIASTQVWVLPNPSGLNAHYRGDELARLFTDLHKAAAGV